MIAHTNDGVIDLDELEAMLAVAPAVDHHDEERRERKLLVVGIACLLWAGMFATICAVAFLFGWPAYFLVDLPFGLVAATLSVALVTGLMRLARRRRYPAVR